jgi:CMP-N,N'-diacetyllegionaminic acid synthase
MSSIVALIPARAGSKRIPGKALKELGGHPLIAWTVLWARQSGIFDDVLVASDSSRILSAGFKYGANGLHRTPSSDTERDFAWLYWWIHGGRFDEFDAFALLRPTSPFRNAESMRVAWSCLQREQWAHSVRAVAKWDGPHPAKMWTTWGKRITGIQPWVNETHPDGTPFHSSPTQSLKTVWRQTGGLEMAWTRVLKETGTISGTKVHPLILSGAEALDINTMDDWAEAERLVASGEGILPEVQ